MEYTAKKSFRYRSRMVTAGEAINLPRAFGLILQSRGAVEPGRPAPVKVKKPEKHDENMKALRAEYRKKFGKGPGPSWDASTIREKLAE
jgi:hypothetical protein